MTKAEARTKGAVYLLHAEVLAMAEDIARRTDRILYAAIRMCVAIEQADPIMVSGPVRDAAKGFRATVEENVPAASEPS